MIDEFLAASFGMPEIVVVSDFDITPEVAEQCHTMGEVAFYGDIAVDAATYKNKLYACPDFSFAMLDHKTRQPVGYFIFLPITNDAVGRYMRGEVSFKTISPSDLCELADGSLYNLFLDTSVMTEKYRNSDMARLTFSVLANAIIEKAKRFCMCQYIFAEQIKDFTKTMCEKFRLNLLQQRQIDGNQSNLYGSVFNYSAFKGLPNYPVLEFAYENKAAKAVLTHMVDLGKRG
jgi:hypothetical protein